MEKVIGGAVVGAAVVVAGPALVEGTAAAGRFLAKQTIKAGIVAYAVVAGLAAGLGRQLTELYEEACAELEGRPAQEAQTGHTPAGESTIQRIEHAVVEEVIEHEAVQVLETLIMAAL
ncbi:hypothetical protein [Nitrospira sp. Kam-Ns4a]